MALDPKSGYYDAGGLAVMEIIKAKLGPKLYLGFILGNVMKYSLRLMHKGQWERDAEKLAVYSDLVAKAIDDVGVEEFTAYMNTEEGPS